jgi:REP element-mobilizing transposase RayT
MTIWHMNAGARGTTRLVVSDRDRHSLLRCIVEGVQVTARLLAWCIMPTHIHLMVEGDAAASESVEAAIKRHARAFNRAHADEVPLLRGPVVSIPKESAIEIARSIRYVHGNPVKTDPPMVQYAVEYPWSSARAFAGLSRVGFVDVARALELCGTSAPWTIPRGYRLADLAPAVVPSASPALILAAAAQTFGVDPLDVAGDGREPALVAARGVCVALGRLESYHGSQLAPGLGRTRQRLSQIAAAGVDEEGVRIARTLLRVAALRARLPGIRPALSRRESLSGRQA